MKTSYRRPHSNLIPYPQTHRRAYPNAAEKNHFLNKALDYALAAATSLGTVTILVFLLVAMT